jgi:superfamily II DNA/RNA helicase
MPQQRTLIPNWSLSLQLDDPARSATRALVLVPTRELSEQVAAHLRGLLTYCEDITIANLASGAPTHLLRRAFITASLTSSF